MKFVMAFLDADGHPAHAVEWPRPIEEDVKVEVIYPDRIEQFTPVAVGLVDIPKGEDARHVLRDLEKHPAADEHPDAPRVRLKSKVSHWCPVTDASLVAHCKARRRDALPPDAAAYLRNLWERREDATPALLAALGMSAGQIADLPKFKAKRQQAQARANAPATPDRDAIAAARIERRLEVARTRKEA